MVTQITYGGKDMSKINRNLVISVLLFMGLVVYMGSMTIHTQAVKLKDIEQTAEQKQEVIEGLTEKVKVKHKQVVEVSSVLEEKQKEAEKLATEKVALKTRLDKAESEKLALAQTAKKAQEELRKSKVAVSASTKSNRQPSRGSAVASNGVVFEATAYTAYCKGCSGITATGIDVRYSTPNVIAVDPRVIKLGSKVELIQDGKSLGYYIAGDTGGDIKGHRIDILMSTTSKALNFGRQKIVVRVLGK